MALIPGFEYDIFISYAHLDNIAFPGQTEGWIEHFYTNLNLLLARRYGRMDMVKIYWDNKKLDGSVLFDQSIEDGINKSAIMICLFSPGYHQSEYCRKELDLFYRKAQKEKTGLKAGNRLRILNVLLNNIPHTEWPKEIQGATGFPFHDAKESVDFGDTLETGTPEFKNQLQNLRDAIVGVLNELEKAIKPEIEPQIPVTEDDEGGFTIYLGEVADSLRTTRKRTIIELEKKGYKVITGIPPPDESEAHEVKVMKALVKSDLSVHMLDQFPGKDILGAPDLWYPQKQAELGLNLAKSPIIWVPSEISFESIEEENYRLFLQNLETGNASSRKYEYIRGSKSTLTQIITDFAEQVKSQQLQKQAESETISVLLDTHYTDQLYALDLGRSMLENRIQPFINPQEDDPRKNINILGERISQVSKLIFLYGKVSKDWVLERMSAALQLIITNNYPIEDFIIYLAPPHKESNEIALNQKFLKINVIDSSNNLYLDNKVLGDLIRNLKEHAA